MWLPKRRRQSGNDQAGQGYEAHSHCRRPWSLSRARPAIQIEFAAPHAVTRVAPTLAACFVADQPQRLIGDKAYDSVPRGRQLADEGIETIAPHRTNRKKPKTQDARLLRRYQRRWKVERLIAWLQNFRRVIVHYEYYPENYQGFVQLGCLVILLRQYV